MTLREFLKDDQPVRNMWLIQPEFASFYVRKGRMIVYRLGDLRDKSHDTDKTIQLANIVARRPGKGAFTRLTSQLRKEYPEHTLFVENANDRFSAYLRRNGWEETRPGCCFMLVPTLVEAK